MDFDTLASALESLKSRNILISGHVRPDGDAIGSQIALCRALNTRNFSSKILVEAPLHKTLQPFLGDTPFAYANDLQYTDEAVICVDCAEKERVPIALQEYMPPISINIDHHISNSNFAEYNFVDTQASATAEILGTFFIEKQWPLDTISAQALYLGLSTDTGQFSYAATNPQTHKVAAKLIEKGALPSKMYQILFENETLNKYQLLQRFLTSLNLYCDQKVCIGVLREQDFLDTQTNHADTEGFVNYARSIENVLIGVYLEETSNGIKGSIRGKFPELRVDKLAENFNGGGHTSAAGFFVQKPFGPFLKSFLEITQQHLSEMGQ